jgi:hypothetical protein
LKLAFKIVLARWTTCHRTEGQGVPARDRFQVTQVTPVVNR